MRATVVMNTNRGWHVHNSFDKLGLFDLGMGLVATLELGAREGVAGVQRRRDGQ